MAKKTDRNHQAILDILRELGYSVASTHMVGNGFGDAIIARQKRTWMIEIKDGARLGWKLTPSQKRFHKNWKDDIPIFDSVDSVIAWHESQGATQ